MTGYVVCFVCFRGGRSVMHELKSVDVNLQVCRDASQTGVDRQAYGACVLV